MPIRPDEVTEDDERRVHERLDGKLDSLGPKKGFIGRLIADAKLFYEMLRDPDFKLQWQDKAKIIACLLYFIAPVDLVPDFIPGLGYIDDAVIMGLTIKALATLLAKFREYRRENPKWKRIESKKTGNPVEGPSPTSATATRGRPSR